MAQRIWLNELRAAAVRRGGGLFQVDDLDLPDTGPDTTTNILSRQVLSEVNLLPEAQRASVMLVYVEGFTYAEAADVLEVPIGTIMSRLAAARKTFGKKMNPEAKTVNR
ncbi:RNA polymerase sigma factor [Rhodobacteraceae bacterium]|nr:RNA polymerase sigma factor [Paracoccaceae bacterium]